MVAHHLIRPLRIILALALLPAVIGSVANRTLVVLIGDVRGGGAAWQTLYEQLLDPSSADCALLVGGLGVTRGSDSRMLFERCRHVLEIEEPSDWSSSLDKIGGDGSWRSVARSSNAFMFGGITLDGELWSGSGIINLWFKWRLKRWLLEAGLIHSYERFVITRADQFYGCPLDIDSLDPANVWVPSGEDYGGLCDRFIVCSRDDVIDCLSLVDDLVLQPQRYAGMEAINAETFLKRRLDALGLWSRVRRFPRSMFTVVSTQSAGQRAPRVFQPSHGYDDEVYGKVETKYNNEYFSTLQTCFESRLAAVRALNGVRGEDANDWKLAKVSSHVSPRASRLSFTLFGRSLSLVVGSAPPSDEMEQTNLRAALRKMLPERGDDYGEFAVPFLATAVGTVRSRALEFQRKQEFNGGPPAKIRLQSAVLVCPNDGNHGADHRCNEGAATEVVVQIVVSRCAGLEGDLIREMANPRQHFSSQGATCDEDDPSCATRSISASLRFSIVFELGGGHGQAEVELQELDLAQAAREALASAARCTLTSAQAKMSSTPPALLIERRFRILHVNTKEISMVRVWMRRTARWDDSGSHSWPISGYEAESTSGIVPRDARGPLTGSCSSQKIVENSSLENRLRLRVSPALVSPYRTEGNRAVLVHGIDDSNDLQTCAPFLHVIISGVNEGNLPSIRAAEYFAALRANLQYPYVSAVHVFWEEEPSREWMNSLSANEASKLVHVSARAGRISFLDVAQYASRPEFHGQIMLITNSDLAITHGFTCTNLNKQTIPRGHMLVPTRQEKPCMWSDSKVPPSANSEFRYGNCDCRKYGDDHKNFGICYDSYLFRSPLPDRLLSESRIGFLLGGEWGSENSFLSEVRGAGVRVYTPPCGLFGLEHHHCSQSRPHQKPRIDLNRAVKRRQNGLCYHNFCKNSCIHPKVPHHDRVTDFCSSLDVCDRFDLVIRAARYALKLHTEFPLWCSVAPETLWAVSDELLPSPSSLGPFPWMGELALDLQSNDPTRANEDVGEIVHLLEDAAVSVQSAPQLERTLVLVGELCLSSAEIEVNPWRIMDQSQWARVFFQMALPLRSLLSERVVEGLQRVMEHLNATFGSGHMGTPGTKPSQKNTGIVETEVSEDEGLVVVEVLVDDNKVRIRMQPGETAEAAASTFCRTNAIDDESCVGQVVSLLREKEAKIAELGNDEDSFG